MFMLVPKMLIFLGEKKSRLSILSWAFSNSWYDSFLYAAHLSVASVPIVVLVAPSVVDSAGPCRVHRHTVFGHCSTRYPDNNFSASSVIVTISKCQQHVNMFLFQCGPSPSPPPPHFPSKLKHSSTTHVRTHTHTYTYHHYRTTKAQHFTWFAFARLHICYTQLSWWMSEGDRWKMARRLENEKCPRHCCTCYDAYAYFHMCSSNLGCIPPDAGGAH